MTFAGNLYSSAPIEWTESLRDLVTTIVETNLTVKVNRIS